jgi:hypothetical protein
MHFMQQIINEVQVQCGGNNIALMQTKVTCEALSDMAFMCQLVHVVNKHFAPQSRGGGGPILPCEY